MIGVLLSGEWDLEIKDFKRTKSQKHLFGLSDFIENKIYLDLINGTARILVHELGHVVFNDILEAESDEQPKSKSRKKIDWEELKVLEFEELLFSSLDPYQIQTLEDFIGEAHSARRRQRAL